MLFLLDIRHAPTKLDAVMMEWLNYYAIPFTVILTKCDKIAKSKWKNNYSVIAKSLGLPKDLAPIYASSTLKKGKEEILELFEQILSEEK